jgi:chromosome condensin MukBEF ATPase and DNA-binding subunit MukB
MSVEFSNAYQEILLDNLMSVIKQNFIFQTQLKLTEDSGRVREELQNKYNELIKVHEVLKDQLSDAQNVKMKADMSASVHEEKSRLQSALNDSMKKKVELEKTLQEKNSEIENMKKYISKLEGIAPQTKLKKINPDAVIETKSVENVETQKVIVDTSTF